MSVMDRATGEQLYSCDRCGVLRTKAEGGTVFTVCSACWDATHPAPAADSPLERARHEHESAIRDIAEKELRGEVARLNKHIVHVNEEYVTMKDVLRAEHQECQRLRSELATLKADLHRSEQLLSHHARELAARDLTVADLRAQVDGRIEWQAHAVAHLQAWGRLFDAAVEMKEGHEGCVSWPEPCGDCFRCRFDKAVEEAMTAVSAGSPHSVLRTACPDCGMFSASQKEQAGGE